MGFTQLTQVANSSEQSNERRAALLEEWLFAFEQEFGIRPKLMPLGEDKEPIIKERCSLESEEAYNLLCDASEAVERMRKGEDGFCCWAGKPSHNTEHILFVDHDEPEAFSVPTGEPTLLVATQQGYHELYRNDSDDPVRNAKVGDGEGEIRVRNQYVLVPGSIHPNGVVYEVEQNRPIQTISDTELDDKHRPAVDTTSDTQPIETDLEGVEVLDDLDIERLGETINDLGIETPINNPGIRLKNAMRSEKGNRIQALWTGHYGQAGHPNDRSEAECALVRYLGFWFEGDWNTVATLMDVSCRQYPDTDRGDSRKWANRGTDYRESLKSFAVNGPTKNMKGSMWVHDEDRPDSSSVLRRSVRNVTKALGIATRKEIMAYEADEASQWDEVDREERSVRNALSFLEDEGLLFWHRSGRHTYYFASPVQVSKDRLNELGIERQDLIDQWRRQTE